MAERERRMGEATKETVIKAWKSLINGYRQDTASGEFHWIDNEADTGFLKDVDALNAIIEPFLLAPISFVDPALKPEEIDARVLAVLNHFKSFSGNPADAQKSRPEGKAPTGSGHVYRGFTSAPYPYVQVETDWVDSAATVLRLICNVVKLSEVLQRPLSGRINEKLMATVAGSAADFLLEARVEDDKGVRWQGVKGIQKETDVPGRYANLFFTNAACLALDAAVKNSMVARWLGQDRQQQIEDLLPQVVNWVANQYDPATKAFWMDTDRAANQPIGVVYALEMIYTLAEPLSKTLRSYCSDALSMILRRISDLSKASALQTDFYHTVPLPSGTTYYDDRRYIGSFLSLPSLAKAKDPDLVSDDFVRAGEILFRGVSDSWIDEGTDLCDGGPPLICYSQDALIGLVRHAVEGAVGEISLRENDLRTAIREALQSDEVVNTVYDAFMERAVTLKEREVIDRLSSAGKAAR